MRQERHSHVHDLDHGVLEMLHGHAEGQRATHRRVGRRHRFAMETKRQRLKSGDANIHRWQGQQQVGRFNVPVDYSMLMAMLKAQGHLAHEMAS